MTAPEKSPMRVDTQPCGSRQGKAESLTSLECVLIKREKRLRGDSTHFGNCAPL